MLTAKFAEVWHDHPDVIISLLWFLQEFCHIKAKKLSFYQISANGILIFWATSDAISAYGKILLANPPPSTEVTDVYKKRFKGIDVGLNVLNSAIGGKYVCYGGFGQYNDPTTT